MSLNAHQFLDNLLTEADPTPRQPAATRLELHIKKFLLAKLLERAAHVVPTRDLAPVLKCVQLHATDTRLSLTATDLELTLVCGTDLVEVLTPGTAVLPARKLLEILRQADEAVVHLSVTGPVATLTVGRTTWSLRVPPGHDYPPLADITELTSTQVPRLDLLRALGTVRYAAARDANRLSLMVIDVRNARMTACDGARFCQTRIEELDLALGIPVGAVDDLLKLLRASDLSTIGVGHSAHQLVFSIGGDRFLTQKAHTTFPDVEALWLRPVIENTHRLDVQRDALLRAVRRVRINADRDTSAVALHLQPEQLCVMARDTHGNEATDTIPATWTQPPRTVVVNHVYLSDLVATTTEPAVSIWLGNDTASRKSALLVREDSTGTTGVVHQMIADWIST